MYDTIYDFANDVYYNTNDTALSRSLMRWVGGAWTGSPSVNGEGGGLVNRWADLEVSDCGIPLPVLALS